MNFLFNLSGANTPVIKEYDIAADTKVFAGEVVGLSDGTIVKADDADAIIGVCAEDHKGEKDEFNARANGTKIRVNIAPDAVYSAKAPVYTASTGSTATTLVTVSSGLNVSIKSGKAILVRKAAGSTNTDKIGSARKISAVAISGATATITLEKGAAPCAGDEYVIIPEIGGKLQLEQNGKGVCFYNSATDVQFVCVCYDQKTQCVGVKLATTIFA